MGMFEADPVECRDQHMGHGGEPQPDLVGAHGVARCPIGEEIQLAFLLEVAAHAFLQGSDMTRKAGIGVAASTLIPVHAV